jgi:uncharacterized protein with HEPN domain
MVFNAISLLVIGAISYHTSPPLYHAEPPPAPRIPFIRRLTPISQIIAVDLEKVWPIVRNDLPAMQNTVDQMLGPNRPTRPTGQ